MVINYGEGGLKKTGGGTSQILPLQKKKGGGVAENVLAMLKGAQSLEVVLTWELVGLDILKGDAKCFNPLKGGGTQTVLPCLKGGGGFTRSS